PEDASVGRLMRFLGAPRSGGGPYLPADTEVGGMQGLMAPWARAVRARGGTIACGWKPVEIIVDGGRVRGAVAVDRASRVLHVHAPVVVCTHPAWEVRDLVDERLLPPAFVAGARAVADHRADLVGWSAGLDRLPVCRADGRPDDHGGWNRFVVG